MELDHLDQLAASAFDGYLVRKDLVRRYSRQYPVPTYVVEFLLGRYCATVNEQEIGSYRTGPSAQTTRSFSKPPPARKAR
jgi:predicted ATP-dependent Lon-type protease